MNIKGLDYNTTRERLVLPEYGREVQNMVDHALTLPTKEERQRCAETIIAIMGRMMQQNQNDTNFQRKLWDHLAIMSGFKLDIDYPYDIKQAEDFSSKTEPMPYPMQHIPVRHYGKMLFEMFDKLKTMAPGPERDELVRLTANQMKRDLMQWGHGSSDNEKVADDLARFTDGVIQLDLNTFKFDHIVLDNNNASTSRRKKK